MNKLTKYAEKYSASTCSLQKRFRDASREIKLMQQDLSFGVVATQKKITLPPMCATTKLFDVYATHKKQCRGNAQLTESCCW
jgi:hypothetical protein